MIRIDWNYDAVCEAGDDQVTSFSVLLYTRDWAGCARRLVETYERFGVAHFKASPEEVGWVHAAMPTKYRLERDGDDWYVEDEYPRQEGAC